MEWAAFLFLSKCPKLPQPFSFSIWSGSAPPGDTPSQFLLDGGYQLKKAAPFIK